MCVQFTKISLRSFLELFLYVNGSVYPRTHQDIDVRSSWFLSYSIYNRGKFNCANFTKQNERLPVSSKRSGPYKPHRTTKPCTLFHIGGPCFCNSFNENDVAFKPASAVLGPVNFKPCTGLALSGSDSILHLSTCPGKYR